LDIGNKIVARRRYAVTKSDAMQTKSKNAIFRYLENIFPSLQNWGFELLAQLVDRNAPTFRLFALKLDN
jgi:hypothetical protein